MLKEWTNDKKTKGNLHLLPSAVQVKPCLMCSTPKCSNSLLKLWYGKVSCTHNEILFSLVWTVNSFTLALFMDGNMTLINWHLDKGHKIWGRQLKNRQTFWLFGHLDSYKSKPYHMGQGDAPWIDSWAIMSLNH